MIFIIYLENGYSHDVIHIFDVYKFNAELTDVEIQYYGNWSERRYHQPPTLIVSNDILWKRRGDLRGHHIRLTCLKLLLLVWYLLNNFYSTIAVICFICFAFYL